MKKVNIQEEQQFFTRGRSVTDAVFVTKQKNEKATKFNMLAHICFIDLTKAFDRMRLEDTVNILMENETPANITTIICNLNTKTRVRTGNQTTEAIPTSGEIREGDS